MKKCYLDMGSLLGLQEKVMRHKNKLKR